MKKRRKRGTGAIHLRKDGRWEGRYVVGYDDKNRPITKNVLARTKAACAEKLKELKASCTAPAAQTPRAAMTFGAWMDLWYRTYCHPNLRPTTQADYENNIYRHIIPELGQIPLAKLTQGDIQQFYNRLRNGGRLIRTETYGKGLSPRMVRACHANCRAALDRAVTEGLIRVNPAAGCAVPVNNGKEVQVLTRDEMKRFLIQAKEEGYYELFLLELATGLRRGEVLALQWDDLDVGTGELRIQRQVCHVKGQLTVSAPKTRASVRTTVLPPAMVAVLEALHRRTDSQWMFPSPVKEDSPLDPATCRKRLQAILEHAQCKKVRFHDLRHEFSTMALEGGMDVKTLSALLGHTSVSTTLNVYTHVTDTMRQTAADKIDRGIAKCEPPKRGSLAGGDVPAGGPETPQRPVFEPYKGKYRKAGTGCVTQIGPRTWEGRFSTRDPEGRRHAHCVYAPTEVECEEKLAAMIAQIKNRSAAAQAAQPM